MKFTADREKLKAKLDQVAYGVASSYYLPVWVHVLLRAQGNQLRLRTVNLETSVEVSMPIVVEEEGACTVPHERLSKWVGAPLSKDTVVFTLTERDGTPISLRVQCGRNYSTYVGLFSEDEMPVARGASPVATVSAVDLIEAIQAVEWAAMKEKEGVTYPVRTGIMLEFHVGHVRLIALDGFNAAMYDVPAAARVIPEYGCTTIAVVNYASMVAVSKLVTGDVQIGVGEGFVSFKTDDVTIAGTTIEGAFPDYAGFFAEAEKGDKTWGVSKAEFGRLLKATAPFVRGSYTHAPFLEIELSDIRKAVTVDGYTVDVGDCMATVQASGKGAIALAVSPVFIKGAVDSITGGELTFVLRDKEQSFLLKPSVGDRHKIVMMPMSIKIARQHEYQEETGRCARCHRPMLECVCEEEVGETAGD